MCSLYNTNLNNLINRVRILTLLEIGWKKKDIVNELGISNPTIRNVEQNMCHLIIQNRFLIKKDQEGPNKYDQSYEQTNY